MKVRSAEYLSTHCVSEWHATENDRCLFIFQVMYPYQSATLCFFPTMHRKEYKWRNKRTSFGKFNGGKILGLFCLKISESVYWKRLHAFFDEKIPEKCLDFQIFKYPSPFEETACLLWWEDSRKMPRLSDFSFSLHVDVLYMRNRRFDSGCCSRSVYFLTYQELPLQVTATVYLRITRVLPNIVERST
jgi:hypothetical protein